MFEITLNIFHKVENILRGSLDSIPSPSPSVKIQILGGKVCLRCKGKTLLGVVNKLLKIKKFVDRAQLTLAHLKQIFPPIFWIFLKLKVMGWNAGYLLKNRYFFNKKKVLASLFEPFYCLKMGLMYSSSILKIIPILYTPEPKSC